MKKISLTVLGIVLILWGLLWGSEGRFHIPAHTEINGIFNLLPEGLRHEAFVVRSSPQKDVIVAYCTQGEKIFVFEFSKNLFFDWYSCTDSDTYSEVNPIHSVASSPLYHYSYTIIPAQKEIQISEGTNTGNLEYALFSIAMGILCLLYSNKIIKTKASTIRKEKKA